MNRVDAPATPAGTKEEGATDRFKSAAAVIVALMVIIAFGILMAFLVAQVGSANDTAWTRFLYLFGAAEAIVFTAVGWLFGQEVNRRAADQAHSRAESATQKAEDAAALAASQTAKGEALRDGIESRARTAPAASVEARGGLGGQGQPTPPPSQELQDLAAFARTLFPR